jgi:hypothetical protein
MKKLLLCAALALASLPARAETVAQQLTKGVRPGMSDDDKLSVLMFNMKKFGFSYRGAGKVDDLLAGSSKVADCGALARLFVKVATDTLKIKNVATEFVAPGSSKYIFVENGAAIVDPSRGNGNVDHGKHWVFLSHVWAKQTGGKVYDVLFGMKYGSKDELTRTFHVVSGGSGKVKFVDPHGTKYFSNPDQSDASNLYVSVEPAAAAPKGKPVALHSDDE